ncbi:MAG: hypothetical protein A2402_00785 [Candidatus Staskawiczbacteria bacterium RIFOXYC1_FULL_37_43]|nr:MAG: hypothetical protein A2813_00715 [Candidatus Staskawiczbacteria bacterium RIFCSPHIGHO2_01_FULL_37_17]OGZ71449.1 MAG: hypothetical protein A2891_00875 [Candidatus Staskawiczbacteria bacterium RIFCSPLOWO2_01_FULL_37_19]OGZ76157.1 MAG: hypothetical protein A2205_03855 [Candidatus Staskawiczbacteria bacterium RIFOXYA1_FULL_37_15]OGZ80125.1 MAG: hypothetical protein A2353_02575 [Candidatus Staskawiczbacteria bacterium RIFOXYB1_FULL_38_37]OGZ81763.1 MAG: hypothetical protein A2402_00785 [Cand
MIKFVFKILIFIAALLCLAFLFFQIKGILLAPSLENDLQSKVCYKETCFFVELAKTKQELEKGLMYRFSLPKDQGMLFVFGQEGIYPFWMRNTLIPLDIIWINSLGEVVFIAENSQPCLEGAECLAINPGALAKYVLEINAGIIEELGITPGSKLDLYY